MSSRWGARIDGNRSRSAAITSPVSSTERVVWVTYASLASGREVEVGDLLPRLDEQDRVGDLAHRPDDLLVAGMADEDDGVAVGGIAARLHVHLRHERAGGVDRPQPALLGVRVHRRRDAVGREHHRLPLGDVGLVVDEHCAALFEVAHDVRVVDDLLAHVDGRAVQLERPLDRLDRPLHARAIASRGSEEDFLDHLQRSVMSRESPPLGGSARRAFPFVMLSALVEDGSHRPVPPNGNALGLPGKWAGRPIFANHNLGVFQ